MNERALVRAHELLQVVLVLAVLALDHDAVRVDVDDRAGALGEHDIACVDGRAVLEPGADERRLRDHQRHRLALHVRAHERAIGVVVLEEGDERRPDGDDLRRVDVHVLHFLRRGSDRLTPGAAAEHGVVHELARLLVDRLVRLSDGELLLLGRVEVDDLVGHLAVLHHAARRLHEAELGHGRHRGERADEADVRALRRLDRAHAPVVRRMHVADLDRGALAREPSRAERGEPPPVREACERVGLVHELRELRGPEELLERRHDRTDVDDRLRRDRVDVFRRHALAHDALHAVEAHPEGFLDELTHRAQTAVPEVLVLVELAADRLPREADRIGRIVLRVLGHAERRRQLDEPADEGDDVRRRQHPRVVGHVDFEPLVQLVAADLGQVVALGIEEEPAEQVAGVLERRRLARALLLEDLDHRLLLAGGRVLLERVRDVDGVVEELEQLLVRAEREAVAYLFAREGAEQGRDRELALAVDAGVDDALLVDLELEPGAAARHQVRDEDLLRRVLGLHEVGARRADELRDDHALGPVDDERAVLGHHGEVAHEDRLLTDLAGLGVDELDRHRERDLIREVLLAAFLDADGRLAELVVLEDHGERAGVVLDRRDILDRLPEAFLHEPLEGGLLDVDQVR